MKQGKLSNQQLKEYILNKIKPRNDETIIGAGIGEDCCAIDTGGVVVVSTDPITASDKQTGTLAIYINANDIASAGAVPVAALVTILIPPHASMEQVDGVVDQLITTAQSLHIDITGGHTEVTDSVRRLVVSVTMIGRPVVKGKVFKTADMRPGDDIIMTKYAGLEGTAIIAQDYADELEDLLDEDDARCVAAMHDVTEGGVIGALAEMCEAAGVGAEVALGDIPVLDVTRKLCAHYGIDVYSLISSGSMLIAARDGRKVADTLQNQGIKATVIGKAAERRGLRNLHTGGELTPVTSDELYKVIEKQR